MEKFQNQGYIHCWYLYIFLCVTLAHNNYIYISYLDIIVKKIYLCTTLFKYILYMYGQKVKQYCCIYLDILKYKLNKLHYTYIYS